METLMYMIGGAAAFLLVATVVLFAVNERANRRWRAAKGRGRVTMTLIELSDIVKRNITVVRHSGQGDRWTASLNGAEVIEGACLASYYGNGKTPTDALVGYVQKIKGKTIVFNAGDEAKRREFGVPNTLCL